MNSHTPPFGRPPHPIPYQGSKRRLASLILAQLPQHSYRTLYEPFAGSAAFTLAAAHRNNAQVFELNDILTPLSSLWEHIINEPNAVADRYEHLWHAQDQDIYHYKNVRKSFNISRDPNAFLYLLTRCVKSAVRFNQQGHFNQSADRRRQGTHPDRMRREIEGASQLLRGRTRVHNLDFEQALEGATPFDLIYLDPPWKGTTLGKDHRYCEGLSSDRLIGVLNRLKKRNIPFLVSYDGKCGELSYGEPLPSWLKLKRIELAAGRSSQATLLGREAGTVESLYLSL